VLPAGWNKVEATRALIEYGRQQSRPRMLGHLFTTWGVKKEELTGYPPLVEGLKLLGPAAPASQVSTAFPRRP